MSRSAPQAVLLVDGYNVVGCWHDLKKVRDSEGLEEARRRLVESLMNYSAYQGYDTRVVFDAQYRDCPSNREVITSYLSVCYTDFGQTADTYIEKACAAFRNDLRKFHSRLIVATSDRAQQLTVVGYGAECISAEQLANEVDSVLLQVRQKRKPVKKATGRFLAHALDPVAQKRLSDMRFGKGG
ncbi:putative RNA-binding protein containing a PIN domain [Leptolyngbyaceae cyanobacterium JSC-12]|nr:putative RNA-binding protein containing a PIN domain [Leptolyngbyaceae cyanobacterium JSC-12]